MGRSFGKGGRGGGGRPGKNGGRSLGPSGSNVIPFMRHLRLEHVLKLYPISEESWLKGVDTGFYPKPVKMGGIEFWRRADIKALCDWFAGKLSDFPEFPVKEFDTGELPLLDLDFDDD